jgi:hypothetical protein
MTPEAIAGWDALMALLKAGMYIFVVVWMIMVCVRLGDIRDHLGGKPPQYK